MNINVESVRKHLQSFEFRKLFINELGWDKANVDSNVMVDDQEFILKAIAQKRGLVVFQCPCVDGLLFPDYATRRKIDAKVRKSYHEHLIIFTDSGNTQQKWQWVRREMGKSSAGREFGFVKGQTGEELVQRLGALAFSLDEEERLTILDVTNRVRAGFDVEQVTKRFYERFKTEQTAFLKFLQGIPDEDLARWYVSVTLNRLMFVYFIQWKGFLDGDQHYLRNRLERTRQQLGEDHFYRDFLCPLFFKGFAIQERTPQTRALLGSVPYLNGGIFQRHQLEDRFDQAIQIPDVAFERLFKFFDEYHWHLDERANKDGNEINPDVLGFIFEKYINQKQMGAYYTKEDITGYISKYTILPALFERARKDCRIAFEGENAVWKYLATDPERYIYPAMLHGLELDLPENIAAGIDDVAQRGDWNRPAEAAYALPTEIWRETVARRQRAEEVRGRLAAGEVRDINDLITYNLDIQQFAQDVIDGSEGPELVRAFWKALVEIKVLDPTCGSGAFLFAALNILEPLYEACLDRMQSFLDELDAATAQGEKHHPEKYGDFRRILAQVAHHPNRSYFIFKSIIVQNLYGVDIMEEAVEICKLRLFLKLIAQVEQVCDVEPLPDIDFNVRAGNTLIGFVNRDEVRTALTSQSGQGMLGLFGENEAADRVEERAELADKAFQRFRQMQTEEKMDSAAFSGAKEQLRKQLNDLNNELNHALALRYLASPIDEDAYRKWLDSYQPFHWFVDFYGIMKSGGFDVIVGNPPYIEYSKVKKDYELPKDLLPYATNLYSVCCYRATLLKKKDGYSSFIVPVSLPSTDRMEPLRVKLANQHSVHHVSFSTRPSKLFDGAEQRLTIYIQAPSRYPIIYSGGYMKWYKEERLHLFEVISYVQVPVLSNRNNIWPKVRGKQFYDILCVMMNFPRLAQSGMLGLGGKLFYKNTGIRYFNTATLRSPKCWINGQPSVSSRETTLNVQPKYLHAVHTFLLSSIFFIHWEATTNCRDLNPADINFATIPSLDLEIDKFTVLSKEIEEDYISKGKIIRMNNKLTGLVELESLTPARSKSLIDKIDALLASYYGFSPEQIDFIQNFEIKYRLGSDLEENEKD
jgi:hypothetical protein